MIRIFENANAYFATQPTEQAENRRLSEQVAGILQSVRNRGDAALREFTLKFDKADLDTIRVPNSDIRNAASRLQPEIRQVLERSIGQVNTYHARQKPTSWLETQPDGSAMGMQYKPVPSVGCYVPGGTAGYPSTVIMTVVPAQMAGVPRIVIASPPGKNGQVNPLVLGVAHLLGIDEVYAIGGAQAIAALTFGTDSVPRVDKIVGPGNAFVNEAKRQVYGTVGIDSLAGPTEVVILADDSAKPMEIARDLFAQAEHDPDARSLLVTDSRSLASAVQFQCNELITHVPRNEIIRASLDRFGGIILVSDLEEGIAVVNELATEHLQIMTRNADELVNSIQNAGAIFVGSDTPVAAGDYCAGPNHVLPTQKNARFSSPLNVLDFMKFSSVLKFSKERLTQAGPAMARFADLEGLPNHKFSIECRHD